MKKLLIILLILIPELVFGQTQFNGTITDQATGELLPGAIIIASQDTTITDNHGQFNIKLSLPDTLKVSFLGYQKLIKVVDKNEELSISLTPSSLQLNDIVISGTSGRTLRNTPTSVQIINPEMIRRDAPFSIVNSINRVPGVYMHSGAYNTSRITIRGIGSRSLYGTTKVKAYFNEVPLTDGSGNSSIEDVDQELIGRVEVIKGPNSSIYGAGLGGAIRISGNNPQPNQISAKTSVTAGSFGSLRWLTRADIADQKKSISAIYSDFHQNGFRQNSEYHRRQASFNSSYQLKAGNLSLLAIFTDLKAYIPSSIGQTDYDQNPDKAAFTWGQAKGYESYKKTLLGLTYSRNLRNDWQLKSTVFFKYRNGYEPRPFNILAEQTTTVGLRSLLSKQWKNLNFTIGEELFRDQYDWQTFENNYGPQTNGSVKGNLLSDNLESRFYGNLFTESTWHVSERFHVTGGINFNLTSYHYTDAFNADTINLSGNYTFHPVVSPKLGTIYQINSTTTLFTNISQGFSPPTLQETLYPDGKINPNIKPESGWNYEFGLRGTQKHFTYDLTTYYMFIKNLLVAQRTGNDQYVGVNAGLNRHFGVDLLTNYYFNLGQQYTLNLFNSLTYSNYHFADFVNEGTNYDGNQLTGVPRWITNPGIELLSQKGFYGNFTAQYTGSIPMNDSNTLYSKDYLIFRSKVGFKTQIKNWQIDFYAGINNITDQHYASMLLINAVGFGGSQPRYYYPGAPGNYYGGFTLKYLIGGKS